KYDTEEKINGITNYYKYNLKIKSSWSKLKKIWYYYSFKSFASKILKKNNYDFIIVWGSYTGQLFKEILIKKYPGKYILNIRDYFYEKNWLIKKRMKKLVEMSKFTTLSSEGFLKFLPKSQKYKIV
ncbi:capsular biosynthesis protein, partial [Staphylococcus hominis]